MSQPTTIEWCVMALFQPVDPVLHRGPMSRVEAETWVEDWEDDGGRPGVFAVGYREVGPWIVPPAGVKVTDR